MLASFVYGVIVTVHDAVDMVKEGDLRPVELIVAIPLALTGYAVAYTIKQSINLVRGER